MNFKSFPVFNARGCDMLWSIIKVWAPGGCKQRVPAVAILCCWGKTGSALPHRHKGYLKSDQSISP